MDAFFLYQMYGAAGTLEFTPKVLDAEFPKTYPQVAFLVSASDMLQVLDFARPLKASIDVSITRNRFYILLVTFDGKGLVSGAGLQETSVSIDAGAHAVERAGEKSFRWAGKEIDLTVIAPTVQGNACFDLKMFNPSNEARVIDIVANGKRDSIVMSAEHTLHSPLVIPLCAPMVAGRGAIQLRVSGSDHPFANDERAFAAGVHWPVVLNLQGRGQ